MTHPVDEQIIGWHVGVFSVPRSLIEGYPEALLDFFRQECIIPVKAEMDLYSDSVHYTALGKNFEPVPMGRLPYHYLFNAEFTTEECGEVRHTIVKSISLRRFN